MRRAGMLSLCLVSAAAWAAGTSFLGVELHPVDPGLAAYLGIDGGAQVGAVLPGSPAAEAGFEVRDIVVRWHDRDIAGPDALAEAVRAWTPGKEVAVVVLRKGREVEMKATPRAIDDEAPAAPVAEQPARGFLGIAFGAVPEWLAEYLDLGERGGVSVLEVVPESPAAAAGIAPRDVVLQINGKAIEGTEAFHEVMKAFKAGDTIAIEGIRAGRGFEVEVVLVRRPDDLDVRMPPPGRGPFGSDGPILRDRLKLRFRDPTGKDHEVPVPPFPFGRGFDFEFPDIEWPKALSPEQIDDIRERVSEAMRRATEQMREHGEGLREKHRQFLEKMRGQEPGGARVQAEGDGARAHSVVVSDASATVMVSDGIHEITVRTEGDAKTVTVKERGAVLVENLPLADLDACDALSAELKQKVRDLERGVMVQMRSRGLMAPPRKDDTPAEIPTKKI